MKKSLIGILSMVLVVALLAGCAPKQQAPSDGGSDGGNTPKEEKRTLVVSHFGLSEDKQWELILKPFEEKFNAEVVLEIGNNAERLTKIKSNPNTDVDVIFLAQSFAQEGWDDGVFEKLDYSKIPNSEFLNDKVKFLVEEGQGPAYAVNRAGIIYNKAAVDFEINSYKDLWRPELKGKIAIPQLTTTFGPSMMYAATTKSGVDFTEDNGESAFKALEELKPNIVKVYDKSSDLMNLMETGEIVAALGADFIYSRMASNPDIVFVDPVEGSYLNFNTVNIVKSSDQKELAYEFINYLISEETQLRATEIPDAPVNTNVELTEEVSKNMTYGEDINKGNIMDFKVINTMMDDWVNQWNRTLN